MKKNHALLSLFLVSVTAGCGANTGEEQRGSEELATDPAAAISPWSPDSNYAAPGAMTTQRGTLYLPVCRASYLGGWQPGKIWQGQCLFEWEGRGLAAGRIVNGRYPIVFQFQTLKNLGTMRWQSIKGRRTCNNLVCRYEVLPVPPNFVDGGPSGPESGGISLPICMADYYRELHPGKWFNGSCHIEHNGAGVNLDTTTAEDLYILVYN